MYIVRDFKFIKEVTFLSENPELKDFEILLML